MNGLNLSFSTKTWVKVCGYSSFDWGVPLPEKLGLFGWMCGVFWRNSLGCGRVVWSGQAWHKFGFQPGSILSWDDRRQEVDFRHKSRFADKSPSQGFIWPIQQTASISTTGPGASTWCFGGVANVFNLGCWACLRAAGCVKTRLILCEYLRISFDSPYPHMSYISYHFSRFFTLCKPQKSHDWLPWLPWPPGANLGSSWQRSAWSATARRLIAKPSAGWARHQARHYAEFSSETWYIYILLLYIYNSDSIFSFSLFYRNKGLYRQIIDVNTEKSVRNSSHNSQMVNYPKGETPTNSSDLPSLLLGFEMI